MSDQTGHGLAEYKEFQPCYEHGYVDCGCPEQVEGGES